MSGKIRHVILSEEAGAFNLSYKFVIQNYACQPLTLDYNGMFHPQELQIEKISKSDLLGILQGGSSERVLLYFGSSIPGDRERELLNLFLPYCEQPYFVLDSHWNSQVRVQRMIDFAPKTKGFTPNVVVPDQVVLETFKLAQSVCGEESNLKPLLLDEGKSTLLETIKTDELNVIIVGEYFFSNNKDEFEQGNDEDFKTILVGVSELSSKYTNVKVWYKKHPSGNEPPALSDLDPISPKDFSRIIKRRTLFVGVDSRLLVEMYNQGHHCISVRTGSKNKKILSDDYAGITSASSAIELIEQLSWYRRTSDA